MKDEYFVSGIKEIDEALMVYYNKITAEHIEELFKDLGNTKKQTNFPPYGYVGGGLYHIGNGAYCNKNGFDQFEKELITQLNTHAVKFSPEIGVKKLSKAEIRKIKNDKFN